MVDDQERHDSWIGGKEQELRVEAAANLKSLVEKGMDREVAKKFIEAQVKSQRAVVNRLLGAASKAIDTKNVLPTAAKRLRVVMDAVNVETAVILEEVMSSVRERNRQIEEHVKKDTIKALTQMAEEVRMEMEQRLEQFNEENPNSEDS